jgi:hypothetical protein
MGHAAHDPRAAGRDNRGCTGVCRLTQTTANGLFDRIETLLDERVVEHEPTLARLESTLTDGYAEALRLDSKRMKIERRIDQVVVSPEATERKAEELNTLILCLSRTREDLERLRGLLTALRTRAKAVRTAESL